MEITQADLDKAVKDAVTKAVEPLNTSITKLETNNAALVDEKKTAATKAKEVTDAAVKKAEEAARKNGDFETMDKSWSDKYTKLETEKADGDKINLAAINDLTAGAARKDIAASMALKGSEGIFEQIIAGRIGVEMRDGKPITIVMDKLGKPSAATIDEFKKELSEDAALKPLLAGSKGSGGGGVNPKGGSDAKSKTMLRSDWKQLGVGERSEFLKTGKLVDE